MSPFRQRTSQRYKGDYAIKVLNCQTFLIIFLTAAYYYSLLYPLHKIIPSQAVSFHHVPQFSNFHILKFSHYLTLLPFHLYPPANPSKPAITMYTICNG